MRLRCYRASSREPDRRKIRVGLPVERTVVANDQTSVNRVFADATRAIRCAGNSRESSETYAAQLLRDHCQPSPYKNPCPNQIPCWSSAKPPGRLVRKYCISTSHIKIQGMESRYRTGVLTWVKTVAKNRSEVCAIAAASAWSNSWSSWRSS